MNWFVEALGYIAGTLTAICFLPQTLKAVRHGNLRVLSFRSYVLYSLGVGLWIIYGAFIGSLPMIIFNVISFGFGLTILFLIARYNRKHPKSSCKKTR